jgi:hypothetical protein
VPAEARGTEWRPLRRAGASVVELDDNVAVYDEVGQLLILLNRTAAEVWDRCDGHTTAEEIAQALGAAHDADAALIAEDVRLTLGKLAELGLLSDDGPGAAAPDGQPTP